MVFRYRMTMVLLAAGLLSTALGCGAEKVPVSGQVTLDGQPVAGPGIIAFYPQPPSELAGASAEIIDGKYEIPAEQGVLPGTYRVEINWPKPTGRQLPSADPGMTVEERIEAVPEKYNENSELTVEIQPDQTTHSFDLKSK